MDMVERLAERIPVVIINNQNEKLSLDAVELDNSKLGRLMARHLLDLGHKKSRLYYPASYDETKTAVEEDGRFFERV